MLLVLSEQAASQVDANTLIQRGIAFYNQDKGQEAKRTLNQALTLSQDNGNVYYQAEALLWLGECAFLDRDYKGTLSLTQQAKEIADQYLQTDTIRYYFTILQNLGVCNSYLGRLDLQRHYYQAALRFQQEHFPNDENMRADALSNLSAAYYRTFMLDSALYWFDSTLTIATEDRLPKLRSIILLNKGKIHAYLHDYDRAIRHQQEALRLSHAANDRILGHSHLSDYYWEANQSRQAVYHLDSARLIVQTAKKSDQQYYSMVELKACQLYLKLGDTLNFRKTLADLIQFLPRDDENFAADRCKALQLAAGDLIDQGQYREAVVKSQEALASIASQEHPELIVSGYQLLAKALAQQGRFQQALEWVQRGLIATSPGFTNMDLTTNPEASQIENLEYNLPLLEAKIEYHRMWYERTGQQKFLLSALSAHHTADNLIAEVRRGMRSQQSRRILTEQLQPFQRESMLLFYHLHQQAMDDRWLSEAFRCAERGRAVLLAESLAGQAAMRAIIPPHLQQEEQALNERLQYLRLKIAQKADKDSLQIQVWQRELFSANQEWEQLLQTLESLYPRYHQLKYELPIADLEQVKQHMLSDDEVLLSFTDLDQEVLCIGISADTSFFVKLRMPSALKTYVPRLRQSLLRRSSNFYPLGYQLYRSLLAPLQSVWQGKNLVLIPDGQLWYVPFNALPTSNAGRRASQQRFLIQEAGVRWLHAAHRGLSGEVEAIERRYHWIGFAPFGRMLLEDPEQPYSFPALPGSITEVQQIGQGLSARKLNTQTYLNGAAHREHFLMLAQQAQVLHLSTHANSNEQDPLLSRLFFHHSTASSSAIPLYASETATLSIPADLVVLSACDTQAGRLEGGEGIAGWAQSFSMAGAKGLLASAWSVNDDTGPRLMTAYFSHLQEGKGKSAAYRAAQREYLTQGDPLTMHPYFWAGFIYLGDDQPLAWHEAAVSEGYSKYVTTSLVIIAVLVLLGLFAVRFQAWIGQ